MTKNFLLYGANGYTGSLIARLGIERGFRPILAGRNAAELEALADRLDLEHRVFGLEEAAAIDNGLEGVAAVLHCAGPFSHTWRPMVDACLRTRTHYLDITGEISVFEALAERDIEARERKIMILPGIGFDVVPTDCLAAHLKQRLPPASQLALGFCTVGSGGASRGTAKTVLEALPNGNIVRQGGKLVAFSHISKKRVIDFGQGPVVATRSTWGDVSTAYYSTGIGDIENYLVIPSELRRLLRIARYFLPIMNIAIIRKLLWRGIEARPPGPTDDERDSSQTLVWGEVQDSGGNVAQSRLRGPEGYTLTALASLAAIRRVLSGEVRPGFQTPSSAFGPDFVLEIDGVTREDVVLESSGEG